MAENGLIFKMLVLRKIRLKALLYFSTKIDIGMYLRIFFFNI